jgi:XRE family transcriptional regulator, regulator of sulfur utilization
MNIGQAIKDIRKSKKISQTDLSYTCGITQAYLSQIENNLKSPTLQILNEICEKLETPIVVLFFKALNAEDIPEPKRNTFNLIYPSINQLISSVFFNDIMNSDKIKETV